jgi:outer membrane beta-barrel protein
LGNLNKLIFGCVGFLSLSLMAQTNQQNLEAEVLDLSDTVEKSVVQEESAPNILDQIANEPAEASADEVKEIEQTIEGPSGVPNQHIFAIQKRFIQKKSQSEILLSKFSLQPVDSFSRQLGWGVSYGYHFTESLGIELVDVQTFLNISSGLDKAIRDQTGLNVTRDQVKWSVGSSLQWTPFSAKAGTRTKIFYFESYLLAGGGLVQYDFSQHSFAQFGLGFRAYLSQSSLLKFEFKDAIDFQVNGENLHRFSVGAGLGFLL